MAASKPYVSRALAVAVLAASACAFAGEAVPRTEAAARPRELVVQTHILNKYVRMLDGQWQGMRMAADGNCYLAGGAHWRNHGAPFFRYDPRTGEMKMLCEDISTVCGEDIAKTPPQGKIHSEIVEKDGWIYFGTHLADYSAEGRAKYTGGHLVGYELATARFRDYGVIHPNYTNYSGIALDAARNKIYFFVTPFGKGDGSHLYRIDIATGAKEDLGLLKPGEDACFHIVVDARGDAWFTIRGDRRALYVARAETRKVERRENALPGKHTTWAWACALPDGKRCLVVMDDMLYAFDPFREPVGPESFQPLKQIGPTNLGLAVRGNRLFWVRATQRPDRSYDNDLLSLSLDPGAEIVNHGRIVDQDGRRPHGVWSLAVDDAGHVFMSGRWYVLPGEDKTIGVDRHGTYYTVPLAVADVSKDLGTAGR